MKNAINYRGVLLMPGSTAHRLHTEGKMKELEVHMRDVEARYHALVG